MANFINLWTILWILPQLFCSCFGLKTKNYKVENNREFVKNELKTFSDIDSTILCGLICTEIDECDAASFDKRSSICTLHFDSTLNSLITEHKTDSSSLIVKEYLRFDVNTLHEDMDVSSDKTILSYDPSSDVKSWPSRPNRLKNYKGAILNYCIEDGQRLLYDFAVILHDPSKSSAFADICLADKATVDIDTTCGIKNRDGWLFHVGKSFSQYYLQAYHMGVPYFKESFELYKNGAHAERRFSVTVNRANNTFSLFDKDTRVLFYSFSGVVSDASLCPVFSVGSGTSVKLLNSY